jgi:adenylosuccinate synthase
VWEEDISQARSWSDLPANAQRYIEFISDSIGIPTKLISVGSGREQIISL